MANRYQDRPFPADDYDRGGDQYEPDQADSDPLAELARLIGQTDPFGTPARANPQVPPRSVPRDQYQPPPLEEPEDTAPGGPPPWIQRANHRRDVQREAPGETPREQSRGASKEIAPEDYGEFEDRNYQGSPHPLHRHGAQQQPEQYYQPEPSHAEPEAELDPSRYDDALYGQIENSAADYRREPAYPDDPYAYQGDYDGEADDRSQKRQGRLLTVFAILALAVVGTGAAFAYRTFFTAPRSGEPPIIKADNSPTKIIPVPSDGSGKLPDRLASGDGTEKIVPREEAPVDLDAKAAGPRVVFPPLSQNGNPPPPSSVSPGTMPPTDAGPGLMPSNGTLPNTEPRKIKTFSVRGDQPDTSALPVNTTPVDAPKPAPAKSAGSKSSATSANASLNAPLSLSPQASAPAEPAARVAATNPAQILPSNAPSSGASGGYLVQVSSQRNEADAQASFRALQNKFPSVLGSQTPVIRRADLGDKGVYYRAMVGPFGTSEEAAQFCGSLKSAGGQCVVQRN